MSRRKSDPRENAPAVDLVRAARLISAWFAREARDLPWRTPGSHPALRRNPYHALVAEAMLQQTQVSRVIPKYEAFIARFPTPAALAIASEDAVLAAWTGLGYYRRARNLHAAAKAVMADFSGTVPSDAHALLTLPGVGRYTAGAVASLAHNRAAPIVDGNVARVMLRLFAKPASISDKDIQPWLWSVAEEFVASTSSAGDANEGLMELGATICLPAPARPRCDACPVAALCLARAQGKQLEIPTPKAAAKRTTIYCAVGIIRDARGRFLIEQRPTRGMWANMWQAPTLERADRPPTRAELARAVGLRAALLAPAQPFEFLATHRRLLFTPYHIESPQNFRPAKGRFIAPGALTSLAMSSPQKRVLLAP